jgi:hypothetical protein
LTSTASHDSIEPAAGHQVRRPDELEHWLTDIRVHLSEDTQAWLDPGSDTDEPAGEPPTRPAVGRHRAAD